MAILTAARIANTSGCFAEEVPVDALQLAVGDRLVHWKWTVQLAMKDINWQVVTMYRRDDPGHRQGISVLRQPCTPLTDLF